MKQTIYLMAIREALAEELERDEKVFIIGEDVQQGTFGTTSGLVQQFGTGLVTRFGIDALVFELNANWIEGLKKRPMGKDWELFGEQLCKVFFEYLD